MSAAIKPWEQRLGQFGLGHVRAMKEEIADLRAALAAKTEGVAKDARCKCPMAISVLGDGCRYCQPQEYIDRLHSQIEDERQESQAAPAMAVEPVAVAWLTVESLDGKQKLETGTVCSNPKYMQTHNGWKWEPLGRIAPAVQQWGEAAAFDKDAAHDATLELVARTIRDWAYPRDEMFVSSAMDAIASLKSQPAAAHPLMDGKSGDALQLLIEVNAALKLAWDRRELPANVIGGDLTRRIYAATKGAEKS